VDPLDLAPAVHEATHLDLPGDPPVGLEAQVLTGSVGALRDPRLAVLDHDGAAAGGVQLEGLVDHVQVGDAAIARRRGARAARGAARPVVEREGDAQALVGDEALDADPRVGVVGHEPTLRQRLVRPTLRDRVDGPLGLSGARVDGGAAAAGL
jgi:hypothetical protein